MSLPASENSSSNRFYVALAAGAGIVLLLIGAIVLFNGGSGGAKPSPKPAPLPFGPEEQAYAAQIQFSGLQLSQANNMLNQEFTYVVGTVANSGGRSVRAIEATVEFHDLVNQVVLRDTVRIFQPGAAPLAPGHERDFQLTFEHVSAQWNRQPPTIRITGLALQ